MDDSDDASRTRSSNPSGKVHRLLESEGLANLGQELEARWTGEGYEREGLRDLAHRFNRELLRVRMDQAGINAIDEEVDTVYRVLTDEETTSSGSLTQLRRRLEREGLDVETLESDFVSRQAIHTYLTSVRGVDLDSTPSDPLERDRRTIRQLAARTENVTADKLARLKSKGHLEIGEFRVNTDVRVHCTDCGKQLLVNDLLRGEGCGCE